MLSVNKKEVEGIIVRIDSYKEDAVKITLLTENGLETYIVRGAKKIESKLRPFTQLITQVKIVATSDKTVNTLTEGVVLDNLIEIKDDPYKMVVALAIAETAYAFTSSEINYKILYDFFVKTNKMLNSTKYPNAVLALFHIKLWYLIGAEPEFKQCAKCGSDNPLYFSIKEGGLVCQNCKDETIINQDLSKLVRLIYLIKLDKINEEFLSFVNDYFDELEKVYIEYYETYFDFRNRNFQLIHIFRN